MSDKWTELVTQLDVTIRQGQINAARRQLWQIVPKEIPRLWVAAIARLTRRARMNYLTLRILAPIVQSKYLLDSAANEEELALYAGALIRVGGRKQGLEILSKLNWAQNPEVIMFQVDAFFSEWNYAGALPLLKKYLKSTAISDYQRLVGRLNLAAGFVSEELFGPALDLLSDIRAECKFKGHRLLYANSLELSAQVALAQKRYQQANQQLELAAKILKDEVGSYRFFLKKWKAIGNLMQKPEEPEYIKNLRTLKLEAKDMADWESVRQMDFFQALITHDEALYLFLMAGTPYTRYRSVLKRRFSDPPSLPGVFQVDFGDSFGNNAPILHIDKGSFGRHRLPSGSLVHRLLILLAKDFYRPLSVGEAFSKLYVNEYFDPESSPDRIRNLIKRLSEWFIEQKIPLSVRSERQSLSLLPLRPIHLVISTKDSEVTKESFRLNELKTKIQSKWFSTQEAASILGINLRSALRVLMSFVDHGSLQFQGQGKNRRYQFTAFRQRQYRK